VGAQVGCGSTKSPDTKLILLYRTGVPTSTQALPNRLNAISCVGNTRYHASGNEGKMVNPSWEGRV